MARNYGGPDSSITRAHMAAINSGYDRLSRGIAGGIAGGIRAYSDSRDKRKRKEKLLGIDMTDLSYDAGLNPNKEPKTAWDFEGLDLPQLATMVSLVKTNEASKHARAKHASDLFWTTFGGDGLNIKTNSLVLNRFRGHGYDIKAEEDPLEPPQPGIPLAKRSTQAGEGFVKSPNPIAIDDILSPEEMLDVPSEQPVIDDILSPEEMLDVPSEQLVIDDILSPEETPEEVFNNLPKPDAPIDYVRAVLGDPDPVVLAAEAKSRWGRRPDGTDKGDGYLGVLELKGGGVATEYSMQSDAVRNPYGRRIDFPTLVPTLTDEEVELMTTDIIPNKKPVPEAIAQKAVDFALQRIKAGKSVWADKEGN